MNCITLVGEVTALPTYHCTPRGRDITRVQLVTYDRREKPHVHHCTAWGPAALDLHAHLRRGDRIAVKGELLYRSRRTLGGTEVKLPYILIRNYTYLGTGEMVGNEGRPNDRRRLCSGPVS